MKASCKVVQVVVAALFASAALGAAPAIETITRPTLDGAPTILYRDAGGRPYTLQLDYIPVTSAVGSYRLSKRYLESTDFAAAELAGLVFEYLPDVSIDDQTGKVSEKSGGGCTHLNPPTAFTISYVNGQVTGNVYICGPKIGQPDATTQWVNFVMFTDSHWGASAHTPIVLRYKPTLHGHGIYHGDTSATVPPTTCSNGETAYNNTRIEAWSQWPSGAGAYNTSTGPHLTDTCGMETQDGWNQATGIVWQKYQYNIHANNVYDGAAGFYRQWVAYGVDRWNGSTWVTHTPSISRDVTYSLWTSPGGAGVFDPNAIGIFIGTTGPLGSSPGPYYIRVENFATGWF